MPGSDNNGAEPMDFEENDNSNSNSQQEDFLEQQNQCLQGIYIVEHPTLDLENYINNYTGLAKLFRLIHVSDCCPLLRVEALKMAIIHTMTTYNVSMYQQLHKKLKDAVTSTLPPQNVEGLPVIDMSWIEQKSKKAAMKLEKLDADLKNYKSNSIKESIRRGHDDLAEHYLDTGDLTNALKCFSRARDYCTSAKHVIQMCLNVIKVSIYLENWSHVLNFVAKAETTPDVMDQGKGSSKENLQTVTKLRCSSGLAELAQKKYKSAAKFFLEANFDQCEFSDMMSPNNVGVYGGLCALASFDREELRKHVISNSSFKLFLELEPQIRDVIFKFYDSKYASCLRLMNEMRENLFLDIYLAPHVRLLYAQIRNRALIQYFSPYASADLHRMAECFNTSVPELENELIVLILQGQIEGRIDSHNKILLAKKIDQRSTTFEKSLKIGEEYERRTKLMILRAAMVKAHIQVKNPIRGGQHHHETPGNSNNRLLPRE